MKALREEGRVVVLQGKVVAVTGGYGNLGFAVVRAALAAGAQVAVLSRSRPPADAASLGSVLTIEGVDAAEPASVGPAMGRIVAQWGGLDALVNVAGAFRFEKLAGGKIETWDELYRVNLRSAVSASAAALPHLLQRGSGRIVNVGSASAATPAGAGLGAYAASKAGVVKFTESLADELQAQRITVNAVLPGTMDTPANRAAMPAADFGRWVTTGAVADVIVYLLSDAAHAVTGAVIPVTRGA